MDGLAFRPALPRTAPTLARAWRRNRGPIFWALVYVFAAWAAAASIGLGERFSLTLYIWRSILMFGVLGTACLAGGAIHLAVTLAVRRPADPAAFIGAIFRTRYRLSERLMTGLPIFVILSLSASAFSSLKMMIPDFHAFDWDATFILWDRWLHGGHDPWLLLQPILGHPLVTWSLNAAYHAWFVVLYGTVFFMAFRLRDARLRAQFFIAYLLCWAIQGNLLAAVFASVGPVFYGPLTGAESSFTPLMAYLEAVSRDYPLSALRVQQFLWDSYSAGSLVTGAGISAMPSLHVASSLLFVLVFWRINRPLGVAMVFFLAAILIGSVHLGYHYAIDGYAAIVVTLAIWFGIGRLLGRDRGLGATSRGPKSELNLSGVSAL
jgi:hypothetical protein